MKNSSKCKVTLGRLSLYAKREPMITTDKTREQIERFDPDFSDRIRVYTQRELRPQIILFIFFINLSIL
jgi:hypothetical protein